MWVSILATHDLLRPMHTSLREFQTNTKRDRPEPQPPVRPCKKKPTRSRNRSRYRNQFLNISSRAEASDTRSGNAGIELKLANRLPAPPRPMSYELQLHLTRKVPQHPLALSGLGASRRCRHPPLARDAHLVQNGFSCFKLFVKRMAPSGVRAPITFVDFCGRSFWHRHVWSAGLLCLQQLIRISGETRVVHDMDSPKVLGSGLCMPDFCASRGAQS